MKRCWKGDWNPVRISELELDRRVFVPGLSGAQITTSPIRSATLSTPLLQLSRSDRKISSAGWRETIAVDHGRPWHSSSLSCLSVAADRLAVGDDPASVEHAHLAEQGHICGEPVDELPAPWSRVPGLVEVPDEGPPRSPPVCGHRRESRPSAHGA